MCNCDNTLSFAGEIKLMQLLGASDAVIKEQECTGGTCTCQEA